MIPYKQNPQLLGHAPLVVRVVFPMNLPAPGPDTLEQRTLGCWPISVDPTGVWGTVLQSLEANMPAYMVSTRNNVPLAAFEIARDIALAPAEILHYNFGDQNVVQTQLPELQHLHYANVLGNWNSRIGTLFSRDGGRPTVYVHGRRLNDMGFLNGYEINAQFVPLQRYFLLAEN
jgi:hypothetical protein